MLPFLLSIHPGRPQSIPVPARVSPTLPIIHYDSNFDRTRMAIASTSPSAISVANNSDIHFVHWQFDQLWCKLHQSLPNQCWPHSCSGSRRATGVRVSATALSCRTVAVIAQRWLNAISEYPKAGTWESFVGFCQLHQSSNVFFETVKLYFLAGQAQWDCRPRVADVVCDSIQWRD